MNDRLIINLIPGDTFLHKLSGASKTRMFAVLIVVSIMTFDIRVLAPLFVAGLIGLLSVKPDWKQIWWLVVLVVAGNLLNLLLFWVASPDIGRSYCGSSTLIFQFNERFIVTRETLWYLGVRLVKMLASFLLSLTYILAITPSEVAAGLYSMGLPYKLCSVVSLALRYIPDIGRDYTNIKISMQCRGVELDAKRASLGTRLKQTVLILVPLIISSFDRIGNIANAMDLRGFGKKKKRTYYSEHEPTGADRVFKVIYLTVGVFCVVYIVSRLIWPPEAQMWYPF